MERKFKITVDGRQYSVTVEDLSDPGNAPHLEHSAFVTPAAPLTPSFAQGNSHSVTRRRRLLAAPPRLGMSYLH